MAGKIYIGTSGFFYPHWKSLFYPESLPQKDWFAYYCQNFSTVEINSTFYHLPKKETFASWRKIAGKKFTFSIKGNRYLTHLKRLLSCQAPVKNFFEALEELGSGLGKEVVLWQLPPKMPFDGLRLKKFLKILPKKHRFAFEFRNSSWINEKTFKILKQFEVALVFQDYSQWPVTCQVTTDFVYLRFHGKTSLYSSCYTEKELKFWAEKVRGWKNRGLDVYAYFNNDALGYAVKNAQQLIKDVRS